ncbi:Tripartite tricarboxylate transporter family receptor [compost metagenome]
MLKVSTQAAAVLLSAHALLAMAHAQSGDAFPSKAIDVIVPYAAGGGVNNMARAFAAEASQEMGQPWVILNKEGAGGVVGFSALARAKPDGYTLAFSPASPMTNAPFINAKMPYRSAQIEPICQIFENVFVIAVRPDSPIRDFSDLIARAKSTPGTVSYGHAGSASVGHLAIATIERAGKLRFNAIAYRGDSQAMADTLGGSLDFAVLGAGTLAGKNIRALAVLSKNRHPALPSVASVTEFGYPVNSQGLNGIFVPTGTPKSIVDRYAELCKKISSSPAFVERATGMSQVMSYLDARGFKALIEETYRKHQELVPGLNLEKN